MTFKFVLDYFLGDTTCYAARFIEIISNVKHAIKDMNSKYQ